MTESEIDQLFRSLARNSTTRTNDAQNVQAESTLPRRDRDDGTGEPSCASQAERDPETGAPRPTRRM